MLLVSQTHVLNGERASIMAEAVQDTPFIAVGYTDKVVFTQAQEPAPLDLRTVWQQTQGSWRHHPVFQGRSVRDVIEWLRGADSDV